MHWQGKQYRFVDLLALILSRCVSCSLVFQAPPSDVIGDPSCQTLNYTRHQRKCAPFRGNVDDRLQCVRLRFGASQSQSGSTEIRVEWNLGILIFKWCRWRCEGNVEHCESGSAIEEFNESENVLIYMRLYIYFECKCGGNSSWPIYTATCDPPPACRWKLKNHPRGWRFTFLGAKNFIWIKNELNCFKHFWVTMIGSRNNLINFVVCDGILIVRISFDSSFNALFNVFWV